MAESGSNFGTNSFRWQIALAVGLPVAVGVGYWYLNSKNSGDKISKLANKGSSSDGREISIDGDVPSKVTGEPKKKAPSEVAKTFKEDGNKCFKNGDYEEAIVCYDKAIEVCPENDNINLAVFYQNKAAAHEQLQKYGDVKQDCTKALSLNPKYTKALLRRAKACEHTKDLPQALEDITAACILENFQSQSTLISADRILKELGRLHAREAISKRVPIMPSVYFVKTYFSSFTNDPIRPFLSRTENDSSKGYLRAVDCFKNELYDEIIPACTEEINLTEAEALYKNEAFILRATFYQLTGDHAAAISDLNVVINNEDVSAKLRVNALIKRASIFMQLEDPASCMNDFNKAVQVDPDNSDIYHHRGQVNLLVDKLKEAADDFTLAVTLNPNYPITAVQKCYTDYRCALLTRDGLKVQTAIQNFEQIINEHPTCSECYTLYAQVLGDQEEYDRADELYLKAIKVDPKNATLYVHRAMLKLQSTADVDAAVKLITEALILDDKCEFGYETLGTIEVQRGNLKNAIEMFDKAIPLAKTELEMSHLYSLRDAAVAQQTVFEKMNIKIPKEVFSS